MRRYAPLTTGLEFSRLADIGEGITECEIIRWSLIFFLIKTWNSFDAFICRNVRPEARVEAFDPLCEVQSDKASVEITSPFDGIVKELLVQEGEVAKVGEGLCLIQVEEENDETEETTPESSPPPTPPPPTASPTTTDAKPSRVPHPLDSNATVTNTDSDILSTPSTRHFAKQNNVNLSDLFPGSGPRGRVERVDVQAFVAARSGSGSTSKAPGQQESLRPTSEERNSEKEITVPLNRTRYAMWKAMTKVRPRLTQYRQPFKF